MDAMGRERTTLRMDRRTSSWAHAGAWIGLVLASGWNAARAQRSEAEARSSIESPTVPWTPEGKFSTKATDSAAFVPLLPTPDAGAVKVTVEREHVAEFLASPAGAGAQLVSENASVVVYRIDATLASDAERVAGVAVRADFHQIWLRRGVIDTRSGARAADGAVDAGFDDRRLALVQMHGPVSDVDEAALAASGVEVVHYLPQNAFLVWIANDDVRANLLAQSGPNRAFAFVDAFLPQDAISPRLDGAHGLVDVVVQVFNTNAERNVAPLDRPSVVEALSLGDELLFDPEDVLEGRYTNVTMRVYAEAIETLSLLDSVVDVEPWSPPQLLSERQAQEVRGAWNGSGTGAAGTGYLTYLVGTQSFPLTSASYPLIAVVDSGIDNGTTSPGDATLRESGLVNGASRLLANTNLSSAASAAGITGHGQLVASVIGGMELTSTNPETGGYMRGLGVSPFARLSNIKKFNDSGVSSAVSNATFAQTALDHGASISQNSWGGLTGQGVYETSAQQYDALTRDSGSASGSQPLLFVFAAGNDGTTGIAWPGTAKNVITVGATEGSDNATNCGAASTADNIQQIASFSARGPTNDGRNKPDIVAPGTHVVGTASTASGYSGSQVCAQYYPSGQTKYTIANGTSFAAPAISGVVSLEWNYLSRVHGVTNPSPALLKAYTLHQTRYLQATGGNLPNGNQGYGFPWLDLAFDQTITRQFVDQTSTFNSTGEHRLFTGTVANPTRPIRIALAWSDAPGSTFGAAWANDLDLTVTVNGVAYKGNVFAGGLSTTGGAADSKNNTELVVLPTGFSGSIQVRVNATNIVSDGVPGNSDASDQDFALVMSNVFFSGGCTPALVTANPAPSQALTICAGSPLSLAVGATGSGLNYKFYLNGSTVQNGPSNTYAVASANAGHAGTYTCLVTNACGESTTAPVNVTVNTGPSITQHPSGWNFCQGVSVPLTCVATGTPAPTYQWRFNSNPIAGATSSAYTIASVQPANAGSYDCVVTNSCGSITSNAAQVIVSTPPVFSNQPISATRCVGSFTQLSVTVSNWNGSTTYAWLKNNVLISGANQSALTFNPFSAADAGTYTCLVTNNCGFTFSTPATLIAATPPMFTTQPASQAPCVGASFHFVVALSNPTPTPTYQWRKNGLAIAGATSSSYGQSNATLADVGTYDCVVTNQCGSATSMSATYTAGVGPTITQQPQSIAICAGVNATLNVVATGSQTMAYEWFHNGVSLGAFTNSDHTIFNPTPASAGSYYCRVFNPCNSVNSNVITVTVDGAPSIGSHPVGATTCTGSPVSFSVSASGSSNLTYQWRRNGATIVGATGSSHSIPSVQASQAGSYDCVVSSTCQSITSNAATLVVNAAPQITQDPADVSTCLGAPASFNVAASSSPAATYQWRKGGAPIAGATSSSLLFAAVTAGDLGTYDCQVTNGCGATTSAPATLTIYTPPTCVSGGAGGAWPTPGAFDGQWPNVLPTGALVSPLSVTLPAGATRIVSVKLNGFAHSWSGDNQIVLETPSGEQINLFQQVDGAFGGGCADVFSGDYEFVDAFVGTAACGTPAAVFACASANPVASGAYRQHFGAWPTGAAGVVNTPLESAPIASGTYTLRIYDWYVAADSGSLASWELCFDAPAGPQSYCTAGTTTNGCNATISASANPSASFANGCTLAVSNVEGAKTGLIFYSVSGSTSAPWNGASFLCVKAPTQRTPAQSSGGVAGTCGGVLLLDWNAFQLANPGALGNPFAAGAKVWAQGWFRDPPAPKTTNLTDAVELTYVP